jgi:hypothetical protein
MIGGMGPRRPDRAYRPAGDNGVIPGGRSGTLVARRIIVTTTGSNTGVFVYSGAPSAGNLIGSWTSSAGTDPYGNTYPAGLWSTNPATGQEVLTELGQIVLGNTADATLAQIVAGGGTLSLTSGLSTLLDAVAEMQLKGKLESPTGFPVVQLTGTDIWMPQSGTIIGTAGGIFAIVGGTLETTHPLGSLGVANLNISTANYELCADGRVFISIIGQATGAVAGGTATFPNAMGAAYQPATEKLLPAMYGGTIAAGEQRPRLQVNTNGQVTLAFPTLANGNLVSAGGYMDLQ